MATRSTIALEYSDGRVRQIYCHWDGYLDHNGQILLDHYATSDLVDQLIQHGSISSLGRSIEDTEFYARDRGEELIPPCEFETEDDYHLAATFQDYNYLMDRHGQWLVQFNDAGFQNLQQALKNYYDSEYDPEDD